VSIGDTLAEARRQSGLTITQVSQRTRIRESIIRGIEQGDFSACGGDFYARGHIRSIAGAIGIDPAPLIKEYDAEHGTPGGISAADVFEPSTPIRIRERRSPSLSMIVIVVLLGIIGFSTYHLVSSRSAKSAAAAAVVHPTAHATALRITPKASPKPVRTTPPPADEVVIHLTAVQQCWVLLTKLSSGSQLYMGEIPAGSSMSWTEKQPVSLEMGNPPGVVLTVNGKREPTDTPRVLTLNLSPPQS
jgi:transcriptional regulator with XRE-family HTH domain